MTSVTATYAPAPAMRRKNRYSRHLYNAYDLDLKKSVVIFAEENGNKEAQARYGISEANIRRWRRLKSDIFGRSQDDYDRGKLRTRKRVNYNTRLEKSFTITSDANANDPDGADSQSESTHSMPLQERLSKVAAQEKIAAGAAAAAATAGPLKSQPLSPTKLKVTRQSPKGAARHVVVEQQQPPPSPVNEEMCLRWNSHHSNMQTAFPSILSKEQYVDVTLAAEGKTLKCHRLILSSCSPYFEEVLSGISPFQHPVLFMRDIPFWILKSLCDFMYAGEVHIFQNKLEELLTVAEALKIKGLAGKSTPPENQEDQSNKHDNSTNNNNHNATNNKEKKKAPQHQEKDREKIQHHPPVKKIPIFPPRSNNFESTSQDYDDDLLDPLDLLEPLYEEVADEKKPSSTVVKPKENKYQYQPIKKPFTRRLRKRKYSEQRDPSPPPVFSFRKGTRSRPNVKIPKYYHTDYSNNTAKPTNTQTDPLLEVDEIKTEPIDVEDNMINYSDEDHYMENSLEPANCDSPIIITSTKPPATQQDKFKKIRLTKPVITEVHTIDETNATSGGLEVIKITVPQIDNKGGGKVEEPIRVVVAQDAVQGSEENAEAPAVTMEVDTENPPPEDAVDEGVTRDQTDRPPSVCRETDNTNTEEAGNSEGATEAVPGNAPFEENEAQTENTEPADSTDPADSTEPADSTDPADSTEPVDSTDPVDSTEPIGSTDPVDSTDPVGDIEAVYNTSEVVDSLSAITISAAETVSETSEHLETGNEIEEVTPLQDIRIEDVRTTCLDEIDEMNEADGQTEEEIRATSLDHLEKEAMNVANAINLESQAGPPDIE